MMNPVGQHLERVRQSKPLIHHITNYVSVNDCANIALQLGALPVMADAAEEVEEMVSLSSSLVLNIGTLNSRTIDSMIKAGKKANQLGKPVVLDPVGCGATSYRTETTLLLLEEVKVTVLKGNAGEIGTLAGLKAEVRGVEAGSVVGDLTQAGQTLAARLGGIVVITGATDLVCSASSAVAVSNGHPFLGRITGTGCMAATAIGAFLPVVEDPLKAAVSALVCFGVAAELAGELNPGGPLSFKTAFFDTLAKLSPNQADAMARIS